MSLITKNNIDKYKAEIKMNVSKYVTACKL